MSPKLWPPPLLTCMTGRGPFYDFEEVKVRAARWIERTIEDGLKGEMDMW
jgi:hypothetical protein